MRIQIYVTQTIKYDYKNYKYSTNNDTNNNYTPNCFSVIKEDVVEKLGLLN